MSDDKVYYPETITDEALPNQVEGNYETSQSTGNDLSQAKIKDQSVPKKRTAVELISNVLNTKSKKILGEFELAEAGGFRIGKYEENETGDLKITPSGITARDKVGDTTFALDGATGDAVFKGEVRSGSLITGEVVVGNNSVVIEGDSDNPRIILYNNGVPEIVIGEI